MKSHSLVLALLVTALQIPSAQASRCTPENLTTLSHLNNLSSGKFLLANLVTAAEGGEISCDYTEEAFAGATLTVCGATSETLSSYTFALPGSEKVKVGVSRISISCGGQIDQLATLELPASNQLDVINHTLDSNGLTLEIRTGGCTSPSDLAIIAWNYSNTSGDAIRMLKALRTQSDYCRATRREKFTFSWNEMGYSSAPALLSGVLLLN